MVYSTKVRYIVLRRTTDGKYLALDEQRNTTSHSYVSEPSLAYKYVARDGAPLAAEGSHYVENSDRGRMWTKDCVPVFVTMYTTVTSVFDADLPESLV